jgi:hypothetical protein
MSSRERANPGWLRLAGRRRNMPSKSTIPLRFKAFHGDTRHARGDSVRSRFMNE